MSTEDRVDKMFFEKWKPWLRWLMLVPSMIISPIVVILLARLSNSLLAFTDPDGIFFQLYITFVWAAIPIYVASLISPNNKFKVSLIVCALILVVTGISIAVNFQGNGSGLIHPIITAIVSTAVVYSIYQKENH